MRVQIKTTSFIGLVVMLPIALFLVVGVIVAAIMCVPVLAISYLAELLKNILL